MSENYNLVFRGFLIALLLILASPIFLVLPNLTEAQVETTGKVILVARESFWAPRTFVTMETYGGQISVLQLGGFHDFVIGQTYTIKGHYGFMKLIPLIIVEEIKPIG